MGLGETAGHDLLTTAPQIPWFPETESGEMPLKSPPAGSSPERWL